MKLINASDLIQLLCVNMDSGEQFNIATHCVDVMPAVDAVPVIHGKWIDEWSNNGTWLEQKCSECGVVFEDEPRSYRYCPNCGARMDADAE